MPSVNTLVLALALASTAFAIPTQEVNTRETIEPYPNQGINPDCTPRAPYVKPKENVCYSIDPTLQSYHAENLNEVWEYYEPGCAGLSQEVSTFGTCHPIHRSFDQPQFREVLSIIVRN